MMHLCLVIADASRARIFTYDRTLEPEGMREHLHLAHEVLATPHARDGHGHEHELAHRFTHAIVTELTRVATAHAGHEIVVLASPRMLGQLREQLEPLRRTHTITEHHGDFAELGIGKLREQLTTMKILPVRIDESAHAAQT